MYIIYILEIFIQSVTVGHSEEKKSEFSKRGDLLARRVFVLRVLGGLIHGGAYSRNFMVVSAWDSNMATYQQFQKRIY